ncbi:hypothetical protein LU196_05925 [Pantoea sp. Mb-10]|uniref:hypothetical protein n=1 Tax=unclassified Pantoea TaxID=2630326 RepID=UPI001E329379|nr:MULTISPECIES: hypothetical protein [unclassified Pantoea]MCE0489592.1 hypothetical protein [Pantoea sp. Mb-10]MCE0502120.1 hypothetical protein [Pantoea sp. Pb-8]
MVQINPEFTLTHRRQLIVGGTLLMLSLICVAMTILFLYVNNNANRRVEDIRAQYRAISDRREARVAELTSQLTTLQHKLDDFTAREESQKRRAEAQRQARDAH